MSHRSDPAMPLSPFALLPLRSGTLFPGTTLTLPVGRTRSVALLDDLGPRSLIGVVTQRDASVSDPSLGDLHEVGTLARVVQIERTRDRGYRVVLEGLARFRLTGLARSEPYWLAEGEALPEETADAAESRLLAQSLKQHVTELASRNGGSLGAVQADESDPGRVADQVAALLGLPAQKEIDVLREVEVGARLRLVAGLVSEARALNDIKSKIDQDVRREVNRNQRDALLREQIRAMKKEIGDEPDGDAALSALKKKLDDAGLPEEARAVADRELRRLESMSGQQAEGHVIRTYLELIGDLPWSKRSAARDDVDAVSAQLDADHAGLDDVKKRILEHMAVLKLTGNSRGTILCLAGPPGVGKTSLGQSIADATGRPFVRISLGGVRDEAEIRGHRRTYVGALPGRVLGAMKKAKARNAVVLLDEIDKLTSGWGGSPEAALLEVLDPEQNKTFTDHYLEIPFDLSEVLFVCTANDLGAISAPLRDRLEIIELQGYTTEEKVLIAKQHLVPKQRKEHAIPDEVLGFTDEGLRTIARDYTREAGVRQLTREITKVTRAVALEVARATDHAPTRVIVDAADVAKYLGRAKFFSEVAERTAAPGVATGLAWTPVGGDILFIETSRMPGKGALEITGQLGDVMKESARAALTYVRSHAEELGVPADALEKHDVHIHVPAGAVPKDGPSAGVTMFTALTSLLTGRRVRPDTAMTGECTLRGKVMPVGGIKAKVLAAHRAGITRVILPARNERDLEEIPASVREAMEFIFADDMREVLAAALEPVGDAGELLVAPAPKNDNAVRTAA
ncbi:MAG: endopeptidase La [Deltaproteobacteria bacterium]|nr:endopeptidase La [Myxococcales bacterium]MDP3221326.1 endopeptidase La [Deltaproteobacteria bacterium]